MHNCLTIQSSTSANFSELRSQRKPHSRRFLRPLLGVMPLLLVGVLSWAGSVSAQTAPTELAQAANSGAPPELVDAVSKIDAAASQGNLQAVMAYYSPTFTNSDGLNHDTLQQTLAAFWQRYPRLTYKTQINSWKADGNAIVAETTTTITGKHTEAGRALNLTSTITSRQRFEGGKIVKQEILSERSQLTSGAKPPTVQLNLPNQVAAGQPFDFDAVVTEPLGDRLLLGAAVDQPIAATSYLDSTPINLELLSAGGLFKVGRAPTTSENRWVSAVIVRDDGITAVTQRLAVSSQGSTSATPSNSSTPAKAPSSP